MRWLTTFVEKISHSFDIIIDAIKILIKRPYLLLPIFIGWVLYAAIIIYFVYYFNWDILTLKQQLIIVFIIILTLCFIFSISSFILLEFVEQIETDKKISVLKVLYETFVKDIPRALPVMFIWAILWFIITLLEAIFSKRSRRDNHRSYEGYAKTLGGYGDTSLGQLTLNTIKSGVRLIVFFIYPAIAWEDEGPINAVKKGFSTIKSNIGEFAFGFISIEFLLGIIGIPVGIIFELSDNGVAISDTVWMLTIVYCGLIMSFYLYIQQMFAAILYMWNMRWRREVEKAQAENSRIIPRLEDVKIPDLLDDIPDLIIK